MWIAAFLLAASPIDAALDKAWKQHGIKPAPLTDDATFLRRASLDLLGVIPPAPSKAPKNRDALVAALIADPAFVTRWAAVLDDDLMTRGVKGKKADRPAFLAFLQKALDEKWGYDRITREIVGGVGPNRGEGANGAVNWLLCFDGDIANTAGTTARTFLAVPIQCAQCHDHVSEKWKQTDFQKFAAFFTDVRAEHSSDGKAKERVFTVVDVAKHKRGEYADATPTAFDGFTPAPGVARRQALADWMVSAKNPWFARAAVERFWTYLLGAPIPLPELKSALADDFAAHGFDLRRLITQICTSRAYALSAAAADAHDASNSFVSRFNLRPLDQDQLFDSLVRATGAQADEGKLNRFEKRFSFVFDIDDDTGSERTHAPTIEQALLLMNGPFSDRGIRHSELLALLKAEPSPAARATLLYARVLSRAPTAAELNAIDKAPLDDQIWELLTSAEFSLVH